MKYFIAEIKERNGELEYDTDYLFQTEGDPIIYSDTVARGWRGDDEDKDKAAGGYWCDGTLIFDKGRQEIPKEDFDILKKYLVVL